MYLLCILFPPLAVLLTGRVLSAIANFFLTLLFWIPGCIHAVAVVADARAEGRINQMRRAVQEDVLIGSRGRGAVVEKVAARSSWPKGVLAAVLIILGLTLLGLIAGPATERATDSTPTPTPTPETVVSTEPVPSPAPAVPVLEAVAAPEAAQPMAVSMTRTPEELEREALSRMTSEQRKAYHMDRIARARLVQAHAGESVSQGTRLGPVGSNSSLSQAGGIGQRQEKKISIRGTVIRAVPEGVLVRCGEGVGRTIGLEAAKGVVLVRGAFEAGGTIFKGQGVESGMYDYRTMVGTQRVRAYAVR